MPCCTPRPSFRPLTRAALAAAVLALPSLATVAGAQVVRGSRFSFTGVADATDLGPTGVALDFDPEIVTTVGGNTGSFGSLNRAGGVTGGIADILVGRGPQAIPSFLTVGGYRFDLLALPSGSFGQEACYVAPEIGQRCTPYQSALGKPLPTDPLSPFYLTNVASGIPERPFTTVAAFDLVGTVQGHDGVRSLFAGTISATFTGMSFQEVLGGLELLGAGSLPFPGVSFSGTFVAGDRVGASPVGANLAWLASASDDAAVEAAIGFTTTPEPGSLALVAVGLAGAAGVARRRSSNRRTRPSA